MQPCHRRFLFTNRNPIFLVIFRDRKVVSSEETCTLEFGGQKVRGKLDFGPV